MSFLAEAVSVTLLTLRQGDNTYPGAHRGCHPSLKNIPEFYPEVLVAAIQQWKLRGGKPISLSWHPHKHWLLVYMGSHKLCLGVSTCIPFKSLFLQLHSVSFYTPETNHSYRTKSAVTLSFTELSIQAVILTFLCFFHLFESQFYAPGSLRPCTFHSCMLSFKDAKNSTAHWLRQNTPGESLLVFSLILLCSLYSLGLITQ